MQLSNRKGARGVQRERNQSKKFKGFNKSWVVGDKLSVFFPIFWIPELDGNDQPIMIQERDEKGHIVYEEDGVTPKMTESGQWDIVVADVWGHPNNDMKSFAVGGSFIPSLTDVVDGQPCKIIRDDKGFPMYDEMTGKVLTEPHPGDVTYQFSLIAPLFIAGEKQKELSRIADKKYTSEDLRREALQKVHDDFDTSKNMNAPRPVVGRLQLYSSTEVVVVPINTDDTYNTEKAGQYTYAFTSDDKFKNILYLLDDIKFKPRDHKQKWLEVQMTFNGSSNEPAGRAEAGRKAVPVGLTSEFTMQYKAPEAFNKIQGLLNMLPDDSELISHRNYSYRKIEERKIARCIESYVVMNSEYLDSIRTEDDESKLLQQASKLMQFRALDNMENQELCRKIQESYEEWLAKHPEQAVQSNLATEQKDYQEPTFKAAPTARELISEEQATHTFLPGESMREDDLDGDMVI